MDLSLKDIFNIFINKIKEKDRSYFDDICIYSSREVCRNGKYNLSDPCVLDKKTFVDEEGIEHLPPQIADSGLVLYCYGSDLYDVLTGVIAQKSDIKDEELLYALNFFSENDSFFSFSNEKEREEKHIPSYDIGVFPSFSEKQIKKSLFKKQPNFLKRNRLLIYPCGSVLIGTSRTEQCGTLCNLISFDSLFALHISFQEAGWSHQLYKKGLPNSPMRNPDDPPSKKWFRFIPNIDSMLEAFPGTDPIILQKYMQFDADIVYHYRNWIEHQNNKKQKSKIPVEKTEYPSSYVRPKDRYDSSDWRQAFDFLRYLSFPIEDDLMRF